ncbi:MAG: Mrp/NBP35 family ATP-binding protein [Bellilinea sp.]|nr:Mrp/NBP35 family ATP-binding protein [Bellilinea sp.]
MTTPDEILNALRKVIDPEIGRTIVELGMVRDLILHEDGRLSFTLALTVPTCPMKDQMAFNARQVLRALGFEQVEITFGAMSDEERRAVIANAAPQPPKLNAFNQIRRGVAVMSGKGGVGKSSLTALLAVELTRRGWKTGILDADLTGPSIPHLFGLPAGGLRGSEQGILPAATRQGIRVVSTNLLLPEADQPVIWRGALISATIQQFWTQVLWGRLDVLLVDLPPGTSDAALTVLRTLPVNGVVLVTAPQGLSALVVRKAVHMLQTLKIPILGVVENYSYFRCPADGGEYAVFGKSHVQEICEASGAPLLARLPIDPQVTELCDSGRAGEVSLPELTPVVERIQQVEAVPATRAMP